MINLIIDIIDGAHDVDLGIHCTFLNRYDKQRREIMRDWGKEKGLDLIDTSAT